VRGDLENFWGIEKAFRQVFLMIPGWTPFFCLVFAGVFAGGRK
jgi:hypothetical protein